ncbi:hypothetical protein OIO90_005102 [Microbotryomycetes sp. JL221]|nr:hypothetical protein OIO90_005102 [Microbotryomycetes sp. JL221]
MQQAQSELEPASFDRKQLDFARANESSLPGELRDWMWILFKDNMQDHYESSKQGFDAEEKQRELFHPASRFFVARDSSTNSRDAQPLGYTIFRYDTEETSSEDDADVVYCYELQLVSASRRKGVGTLLSELLLQTGKDFRMDKVMLTVFSSNRNAISFYEHVGFTTDEIDPSRYGEADADYKILSRACV